MVRRMCISRPADAGSLCYHGCMVTMPAQGAFLDVDRIVSTLGITQGQHAADLGCGSGYFTIALARAVGASGIVTAVDVMEEPLQSVQTRADAMGLKNVRTVRADLEVLGGTKIPDASQDLTLLKNVLFQSQKKDAMIREAARMLKQGGRLVAIDWKKRAGGFGPPDDLRPDPSEVQRMAQDTGLRLDRELTADRFHFGLIFIK